MPVKIERVMVQLPKRTKDGLCIKHVSEKWRFNMKDGRATRAAIYGRVSTDGQTVGNQLRELRMVAEQNGWQIVEEFIDKGISGAKGREHRPAFDAS
jgi:hypothetical protein